MTLVGCGAGGVIGDGARSRTAPRSRSGPPRSARALLPFHATVEEIEEGSGALSGMPDLAGAAGAILLADPFSFPTDAVLRSSRRPRRCCRCWAGSPRRGPPTTAPALFLGDEVATGGAVGVRFDGVELLPCVSQGAAPLGPELTITAAEGNVIRELAGRPALRSYAR